jgi:hypothetical protein
LGSLHVRERNERRALIEAHGLVIDRPLGCA